MHSAASSPPNAKRVKRASHNEPVADPQQLNTFAVPTVPTKPPGQQGAPSQQAPKDEQTEVTNATSYYTPCSSTASTAAPACQRIVNARPVPMLRIDLPASGNERFASGQWFGHTLQTPTIANSEARKRLGVPSTAVPPGLARAPVPLPVPLPPTSPEAAQSSSSASTTAPERKRYSSMRAEWKDPSELALGDIQVSVVCVWEGVVGVGEAGRRRVGGFALLW